jgi:hypothetical protein
MEVFDTADDDTFFKGSARFGGGLNFGATTEIRSSSSDSDEKSDILMILYDFPERIFLWLSADVVTLFGFLLSGVGDGCRSE